MEEQEKQIIHLQKVANMLLKKVENRLQAVDPADLPPQSAKHISATLKDIRDIQLLQTNEAAEITVTLAQELEELSMEGRILSARWRRHRNAHFGRMISAPTQTRGFL